MSIITLIEILIFVIGATLYNFRLGEKISEAIAKSLFFTILFLSFSFQIAFLLGNSKISFLLEVPMLGLSLFYIKNNIDKLQKLAQGIKIFFGNYKIILSILLIVWIYLFCLAVLLPPSNWDSMTYNLARILLFQQEQSLFLTNHSLESQVVFSVASDILHHAFLRFYTDYGIGIFSFIAYLIICFATYALSRRYANEQHSLTATLIIASLPEIVLQSTSTKNDIWTAATAIICFVLLNRLLTKINLEDLVLLPITISFGISSKTTFIGFALPFLIMSLVALIKQYSWQYLINIIIKYKLIFALSLLPIIIFFPLFTYFHNYHLFGSWGGSETFTKLHKQTDGMIGTLGNLVRYTLQSIDFLEPLELVSQQITKTTLNQEGYTISDFLMEFYNKNFHPFFKENGIMKSPLLPIISNNQGFPFFILRGTSEDISWFGFFGFFLVIPSVLFGIVKGDLFLKIVSFNLICYAFILCNQLAWFPWANRYFSLFFASSGVLIAYLFSSIKLNNFLSKLLTILTILIFFYVCTFNNSKPVLKDLREATQLEQFNPMNWQKALTEKSIWSLSNLGRDRQFYFDVNYFPSANLFSKYVSNNSTVALVTTSDTWIYQYLFYNPKINIIPFNVGNPTIWENIDNSPNIDYIFCLNLEDNCNYFQKKKSIEVLWSSSKGKNGILLKLPKR